jgi:hypothetical protein
VPLVTGAVIMARRFRISGVRPFLYGSYALYLLIITTAFIYDIFGDNAFVITVYWALLAFLLTGIGIEKNLRFLRTLGLYLLCLTVGKILIIDIWTGLDNAITRVIALIFTGILMIVLSVLYTRKYGQNLRGELDFANLLIAAEKYSPEQKAHP